MFVESRGCSSSPEGVRRVQRVFVESRGCSSSLEGVRIENFQIIKPRKRLLAIE